jgi:hypothetical protein
MDKIFNLNFTNFLFLAPDENVGMDLELPLDENVQLVVTHFLVSLQVLKRIGLTSDPEPGSEQTASGTYPKL